jgi:protein TonB
MKNHIKAFQLSLLVHILIILSLLTVSTRLMTRETVMVINLSTLDVLEKETQNHMHLPSEEILRNAANTRQKNLIQPSRPELPLQGIPQKTVVEYTKSPSRETLPVTSPEEKPENESTSKLPHSADFSAFASGVLLSRNDEGEKSASQDMPVPPYTLYVKNNFLYIRDLIQKNITYPMFARHMGWQGKVTVSFLILSDGRISDIKVKQSSGKDILDKNAVETVKRASPFPPPPVKAEITVPVVYALH